MNAESRPPKTGGIRAAHIIAAAAGLGIALSSGVLRGQQALEAKSFKFAEYYASPHEAQMNYLLEGARAETQPGGKMLVIEPKLQTFRENGEREMMVECPQCIHDQSQHSINSAGPLRVQTADGKFSIEGEGFLWQQTNSSLFISNRVHTIVHPELLEAQSSNAPANMPVKGVKGIEIFSDQFRYAADSGKGVYQGNVRVEGTNLSLMSGVLTVVLPMHERQLQSVIAEKNVIIDYENVHATGGRAIYSADTGLVQVEDHPTWRAENLEGSGDELMIDRTNKIFRANGNAYVKIPSQSMGGSGFLPRPPSTTATATEATNQFVEIRCDNYERRTNSATFHDHVRLTEMAGDQLKGKMSCGLMTVTFAGTNELQQMVAENNVLIEQEDAQFTAGRAVYSGASGVLELTDKPAWRAGAREGKGDLLLMNVRDNEMTARGNAFMRLPANEITEPAGARPNAARLTSSEAATNQFADIFSEEYSLKPDLARFRGKVRIDHPQMKCVCERMSVELTPGATQNRRMVAEQAVVFDLTDDKGQKLHGTGEKAVYTYRVTTTATNDLMVLTGNPILETAHGVFTNSVIVLDRGHNKLIAPGKYQFRGLANASGTQTLRGPEKHAE